MGQRLDAKAIIYPEVFPIRRPDRVPRALEDRAGYFCADTFTPLTQNSFTAAKDAANVALTAAGLVANGERFAYALCRPPGHHAERRIYGGFCFLNNSAIAANYLSRQGTVALLDIDYHHGNGGQDIFYDAQRRADRLDPRPPEPRLPELLRLQRRARRGRRPGLQSQLPDRAAGRR